MTSRQFVRPWLSTWHLPGCEKDGNGDAGPLSHPSGGLALSASHPERPAQENERFYPTASAVDWRNLGAPPSRPHPALLQKLSRQGSKTTGGARMRPGLRQGARDPGRLGARETGWGEGSKGARVGWASGATSTSRCRGEAGGAQRRAVRAPAHPRSAASRCFGVWSPAPPPSARTGSGLSGTARTLRGGWGGGRHGAAGGPTVPAGAPRRQPRRGAPGPHLAAPASDSWRQARRRRSRWAAEGATAATTRPPTGAGLLCVLASPGQPTGTGTRPSRGDGRARAWRHSRGTGRGAEAARPGGSPRAGALGPVPESPRRRGDRAPWTSLCCGPRASARSARFRAHRTHSRRASRLRRLLGPGWGGGEGEGKVAGSPRENPEGTPRVQARRDQKTASVESPCLDGQETSHMWPCVISYIHCQCSLKATWFSSLIQLSYYLAFLASGFLESPDRPCP